MTFLLVTLSIPSGAFGLSSHESRPTLGLKAGTVDAAAEQDFLSRTNSLRASLGLGSLRANNELLAKARNWAQTMASSGTIFHSTLTDGVTQNWHRLGENVGMGPDVASIQDALVHSPRHYENLADSGFTDVGIGVVRQGDVIYVSEVFMELMPSSAPKTTTTTVPKAKVSAAKVPAAHAPAVAASTNSTPVVPISEAAPLATASPDLSAIVKRLSALES